MTLFDMAANNSKYFTSNTEIFFLPGVHYITSQVNTWIGVTEDLGFTVFNISLTVKNAEPTFGCSNNHCYTNSLESAIINCSGTNVGFAFRGVSNLTISGLKIVHCGVNTKFSKIASVFTSLFLHYVEKLMLSDITVEHSTGFGLLAIYLTENSTINKCTFRYNHATTHNLNGTEVYLPGGNAYIAIGVHYESYLTISKSVFAHGVVKRKTQLFKGTVHSLRYTQSAGLSLDSLSNKNITISNCTFTNNTAPYGANMLATAPQVILKVINCIFSEGKATENGGGVYINNTNWEQTEIPVILFSNSIFKNNTARYNGGGLFVNAYKGLHPQDIIILVEKCTFTKNKATLGGAIYIDSTYNY